MTRRLVRFEILRFQRGATARMASPQPAPLSFPVSGLNIVFLLLGDDMEDLTVHWLLDAMRAS
jgi:hypothetical protein